MIDAAQKRYKHRDEQAHHVVVIKDLLARGHNIHLDYDESTMLLNHLAANHEKYRRDGFSDAQFLALARSYEGKSELVGKWGIALIIGGFALFILLAMGG